MIDLAVETPDEEIKRRRRRRSSRCRDAAASAMPKKNLKTGDNWVNEIAEEEEDKEVLFWVWQHFFIDVHLHIIEPQPDPTGFF